MVIMVDYSTAVNFAIVYSRITSAVCVTIIFLYYSSPVSLRESSTNCFNLSTCNFWTSEPDRDGIHRESLVHILLLSSVIDYIIFPYIIYGSVLLYYSIHVHFSPVSYKPLIDISPCITNRYIICIPRYSCIITIDILQNYY